MNLTLEQYERLNPRCEIVHKGVRMVFVTPGTALSRRSGPAPGQQLANPFLRSLLIEPDLNLDDHRATADRLAAAGFRAEPGGCAAPYGKQGHSRG